MNKNLKKLFATLTVCVTLSTGGFSNVALAKSNANDKIIDDCKIENQIDEAFTKSTDEEIKISNERLKQASKEYEKAINSINKKSKIQESDKKNDELDSVDIPDGEFNYKVLGFPSNKQINGYYCGPASAYNLLCGIGCGKNVTQEKLAASLGTTKSGTSFGSRWSKTLNKYAGGSWNVTWASNSGWDNKLISALYSNLKKDKGIICDTHQTSNGPKISNHYKNSSNTWHYIASDGINLNNKKIHFVDSNSRCAGKYWTSYSTMAKVTSERGIVW